MNAELQQLKDIHLPPALTSWLIAPGWLMLLIIFLSLIVYLCYRWVKQQRKRYVVKFALSKLNDLRTLMAANPDNINIAAELSILIRRTALYYFDRKNIAGLIGIEWLNFLNQTGHTSEFTTSIGHMLLDAPYRKPQVVDLAPLFVLTQTWLHALSKKNPLVLEK